jgi:hypothetical protein
VSKSPEKNRTNIRNWGFLLTEGVLIVASILFAFALDSWWDERKDHNDEQAILHALHDEFTANREVVVQYRGMNLDAIESLEAFLSAFESGRWDSDKRTPDEALAYLLVVPTPDVGAGVLNALISSGRIELLQSGNLRIRLANWKGVYDELLDDLLPSKRFAYDTVIPFVIGKGLPASGAFESLDIHFNEGVPLRTLTDNPEVLGRLLTDPQLRTMLEIRVGILLHADDEYDTVLKEIDGILSDIEALITTP